MLLRKLCERHRPAVLLVTHDVDEAIVLADRVIVLDEGRIAPRRARSTCRHPASRPTPRFAELRARLLAALGVEDDHCDPSADRHGAVTTAAPQRVPDEHRPPRGVVAAAGERPVRAPRRRALPASWPGSPSAASSTRSSSPTARRCAATSGRRPAGTLEPTVLLTAIAAATERIGLIATASTTYNEPYNLARRFASLDHVSGGRAGWNIVTTAGAEPRRNFGLDDQPAHAERYERADGVPRGRAQAVGQLGGRRRRRRQGDRASGPTPTRSTRSTTSASTSGCAGR